VHLYNMSHFSALLDCEGFIGALATPSNDPEPAACMSPITTVMQTGRCLTQSHSIVCCLPVYTALERGVTCRYPAVVSRCLTASVHCTVAPVTVGISIEQRLATSTRHSYVPCIGIRRRRLNSPQPVGQVSCVSRVIQGVCRDRCHTISDATTQSCTL
jgi:hypothetical protein